MKSDVLLEMEHISKTFPGVKALNDVRFKVHKGEVMALMGENGAGKSTLIKIITGYYRKDAGAGSFLFDGKDVNPRNTDEASKLGISTNFQELNLSPFMSVAENIYLGNTPKKAGRIDWKRINEDAEKVLQELGIHIDVTAQLNTQSTAVQQMVSIARATSRNCKLLIMDEATSSLDNEEVAVLFDVIRKLKERQIATVFITHKMDEIYQICDAATILKDGEYVDCLPMEELPKLKLISMMIGRDASTIMNKRKQYNPEKQEAEVICEIKEIRKANRRLNGVNLKIHKGEVLGLSGLLGSGRTETAKVLFGDDTAYEGEVVFGMQAIKFKQPYDAIKKKMAFCSEDRKAEGIFPYMSVRDNLTMTILPNMTTGGVLNRGKMAKTTQEYIDRMAIKTPSQETKIKDLSGGNQQKVILSRWLATHPDLIILDEPTRGIDVGAKDEIQTLIEEISAEGISVLYISSELSELVRECDRVVVLHEGRNIGELVNEEISEEAIMNLIAGGSQDNKAEERNE